MKRNNQDNIGNKRKKGSIKVFFINNFNKLKKIYYKKIVKNRARFKIKEVVFIMLITFVFGMLIGGVVMYGKGTFSSDVNDSLNEFADTYQDILNTYYQDISSSELLQAGIEGMIDYLGDPYATYMDADTANSFNEEVEGEYSGIGAEIRYSYDTETFSFSKIFEGGPSDNAEIKVGDILLEVNGEEISTLTVSQLAEKVKGKKGTTVQLTIKRGEEEFTTTVKRDVVDIESVTTNLYTENNKRIGYIKISIFAKNTYEQFRKKLLALEELGFDELLIDVRNNTGGYLTTVTDIISMFTEKGSVIYQLNTKGDVEKILDDTKEKRNYPVNVLTNGGSASASEVLTSALKENYQGTVFGTKTYGKGKVQKAYDLSNGAKIKYTFQEWLTPLGNSIDGCGVEPNVKIENVVDDSGKDYQLEKTLKEIAK